MSIRAQLRDLRIQTQPNIRARPIESEPGPIAGPSEKWHSRTVQIYKTVAAGTAAQVTLGNIITALTGNTGNFEIRIKKIKVWSVTLGGTVRVILKPDVCTIGTSTTATDVVYSDSGSGTRLAGMSIDIPDCLARSQVASVSTTTNIMDIDNPQAGTGQNTTLVTHVVIDFLA
jgi:hypothetical protein